MESSYALSSSMTHEKTLIQLGSTIGVRPIEFFFGIKILGKNVCIHDVTVTS